MTISYEHGIPCPFDLRVRGLCGTISFCHSGRPAIAGQTRNSLFILWCQVSSPDTYNGENIVELDEMGVNLLGSLTGRNKNPAKLKLADFEFNAIGAAVLRYSAWAGIGWICSLRFLSVRCWFFGEGHDAICICVRVDEINKEHDLALLDIGLTSGRIHFDRRCGRTSKKRGN